MPGHWLLRCSCRELAVAMLGWRQRTGGEHFRQPVLSIVCQASMALCRSIRLRVSGMG